MKYSTALLKWFLSVFVLIIILASCKPKKCATFDDPKRDYKVKYDRHGLKKR